METPMTFQQHYADHQRQAAWINEKDWQFEQPARRTQFRTVIANALIVLAARLVPTTHSSQPTINA